MPASDELTHRTGQRNEHRATYEILGTTDHPGRIRCHLAILKDAADSYSVIVLNLPGVGSCGETEAEAIENTREAVAETVASFRKDRVDIPWAEEYEIPAGAKSQWILVDA